MPYADNQGIKLYFEEWGPKDGPVVVFVQGYGAQLITWDVDLLESLANAGLHCVAFDNRDIGFSDKMADSEDFSKHYEIDDMASDVVSVAQAIGAERFHIVGGSMGGMICQKVLNLYPERIKSATLFFTVPSFTEEWMANPQSKDVGSNQGMDIHPNREAAIEEQMKRILLCMEGTEYPIDYDAIRLRCERLYDRCYRPDGWRRQKAAVEGHQVDEEKLAQLTIPTCVIHGEKDPFFSTKAAIYLHQLLPHNELHLYPGMSHEMPKALNPDFVAAITRTVQTGEK